MFNIENLNFVYVKYIINILLLDRSPRYNYSKIIQKDFDSITQSIYHERRKSFLASLDTILRQIGCVNRRDITNQIDNIVINNLSSEKEIYLSKLSELITKDMDQNKKNFESMCDKLVKITDDIFHQENDNQKIVSENNNQITNIQIKKPFLDLLTKQLSQISNVRGEISILKSLILSIISTFLSSLTSNRQQFKSQLLHFINEYKMQNDQLEIHLKTQQKAAKDREQKIASMEQTISDLNDQITFLKQQRTSNARVTQLERQLAEKNRQFEEQKTKSDEIITELEQELEEKTNFLEKQRKAANDQIFQLEQRLDSQLTKLDFSGKKNHNEIEELEKQIIERDKVIEQQQKSSHTKISQLQDLLESQRQRSIQLSTEIKNKESEMEQIKFSLSSYEAQISKQNDTITMLEAERSVSQGTMTINELEDLRQDTQEKDEEIQNLKSKLESLSNVSNELDSLRREYLKKSQEVDDLKRSTENAQKSAIELESKNNSLLQSYKSLELQLSHGQNEKSSLKGDIDHALMICQIRKKKIKQLKLKNSELQKQLANNQQVIENQEQEISQLKSETSDISIKSSYLKQQLSVSQTDYDRNGSLMNTMKEKLKNAMSLLQQKEKIINELIENDKKKGKEIDGLNKQIAQLKKDSNIVKNQIDLINNTHQIESHLNTIKIQEEQINSMSNELIQIKANNKSLEITSKEQQKRISDLLDKINEDQNTIKENEDEIHRLLNLTSELSNQHSTISDQNDEKVNQIKENYDQVLVKMDKLNRKNQTLLKKINQFQDKIQSLTSEIEKLSISNLQLKAENSDLNDQIKSSILPLKQENEKLMKKVFKLTNEKQSVNEAQANSESLYKELKIQSQSKINILEKKVTELNSQLQKEKENYDNNLSQLEQHFESLNMRIKGTNSSNDKYNALFQELQQLFSANSIENLLQKSTEKINECESLRKELHQIKSNAEELSRSVFENEQKVDNLSFEKAEQAKIINQLQQSVKNAIIEKKQLNDTINELRDNLQSEKDEHETVKSCFNELKNDIAGIKEIIPFESLSSLKKKLARILESNSKINANSNQSIESIRSLESELSQAKKENTDNSFIIKEQKNQIAKLTKSEQDLKRELLKISKESNSSTFELQNQLQKTKDQLKILNSSITKLHEVVTFTSDDDIYIAVSSAIRQKNQLISDLQHQLQKNEVTSNDSLMQIDTKTQKISEQQSEIIRLKNEKIELKRDKQQLEEDMDSIKKQLNALKIELDQNNENNSKIQSQIASIIQFSSFDELPTILTGFKQEFDLQKQKNSHLKETNNQLQSRLKEAESTLEEVQRQNKELFQEKQTFQSQIKRKEIVDSQIFGVSNIRDLPKKFTEQKQKLEQTEQRLNNMSERCRNLNSKLAESDQSLFEAKNLNEEYRTKIESLETELETATEKTTEFEEKTQSMKKQIQEYEIKNKSLKAKSNELNIKVNDYDSLIKKIRDIIDFEDTDSITDIIQKLKDENDKKEKDIITGKEQLQQICEIIPGLFQTDYSIPISSSNLNKITESLQKLVDNLPYYKK